MPLYGPHNLRWLEGPNAADQLAALANPISAAEGVIPEMFGKVLDRDDLGTAMGDIYMNLHPLSTLWDHLGSMLEDYTRPRLIRNMLSKMDKAPVSKLTDYYDAMLAKVLGGMKQMQNIGESPEMVTVFRRTVPAAVKGMKSDETR